LYVQCFSYLPLALAMRQPDPPTISSLWAAAPGPINCAVNKRRGPSSGTDTSSPIDTPQPPTVFPGPIVPPYLAPRSTSAQIANDPLWRDIFRLHKSAFFFSPARASIYPQASIHPQTLTKCELLGRPRLFLRNRQQTLLRSAIGSSSKNTCAPQEIPASPPHVPTALFPHAVKLSPPSGANSANEFAE